MRVLLDTNILLRSAQPNHPLCSQATYAVSKLLRQKDSIFFCPQNIAEFWNVATRPVDRNGFGLTPADVDRETRAIEMGMVLLPDREAIYHEWRRLVVAHAVSGVQVHDARLAAAMRVHGVTHLLTLNTSDFERYPGITAVHPASLAHAE